MNIFETNTCTNITSTSALAFKIATDPYVGRLTFFRVYSGKIEAGSYISSLGLRSSSAPVPGFVPTTFSVSNGDGKNAQT